MSSEPPTAGAFSKLIVYVDESGDHGPVSAEFPVFVLAFCIFDKHEYANTVTSYMHRLKFKHFGHDAVVMHERDIRKSTGPFTLLINPVARNAFLSDISVLIEKSPLVLIAAVIDKAKLAAQHAEPPNPYHLALKFGLERIHRHRAGLHDEGKLHVVFESRGKREDEELELEFRRVCDANATGQRLEFEAVFAKKEANHCGLQLADLVARPIGRHFMNPGQSNRAYEQIEKKFRRSPDGSVHGWGLKCFP
jgi:hypothetical protein